MKISKLNFKNNFYLITWIFHDPISTKWLKGFQKYFAYKLPMVQGCTQTILVSIGKNYIFFKIFHCCKMRPDGPLGSHCAPPHSGLKMKFWCTIFRSIISVKSQILIFSLHKILFNRSHLPMNFNDFFQKFRANVP